MMVVLQFFAVCSLLFAAPKASGFAFRDQNGYTGITKLEIENLLYDAIFNSSTLVQYVNQTLNTTVDSQSLACLDTHTLRNVEVIQATGTKMRWCTFVSEMDLEKYFNTHDGVTFKLRTMAKIVRCTHRSNGFKMLECYADTIATGLNTVKDNDLSYYYYHNYNYNWRQKRCLQKELYRLVPKMYAEWDRLMNCMRHVNEMRPPRRTVQQSVNSANSNGSNKIATDPWVTLPLLNYYSNSSTTLPPCQNSCNSTNSTVGRTRTWVTLLPSSISTNSSANETTTWVTLPPLSNSANLNFTLPPWNYSINSNTNETMPWVILLPSNNSTYFKATNSWVTLSPWINSTNSNSNFSPWNNSTKSNETNLWLSPSSSNTSTNPTNSSAHRINSWLTMPLSNNSINSKVTNSWITLPPWNNSTNSNTNGTNSIMTLPPWNNSNNFNATNQWVTLPHWLNSTNFKSTLPPWNNSTKSNETISWLSLSPSNNSTNPTNSNTNRISPWVTSPLSNNSSLSNNSNVTNSLKTLPPRNNSTNLNATDEWVTQPHWLNNSTKSNVTNPWTKLPPSDNSTNSINANTDGTTLLLALSPQNNSTIFNITNPLQTLPPLSNSANSKSNETYSWVIIANTTVAPVFNDTKSPIQSPFIQTTETPTEPTTPNNVKKPSWWSSIWNKVTNVFK